MRYLRAIPVGLGRMRAANYVYRWRFQDSGGDLRPTSLSDGSRFELEIGEWPQAQAFLLGEYDRETVRFISANLPPGGTFVDAGAHVGLISFQVLQRVPTAAIHAFEPHPERGRQFARHRTLNGADDQAVLNPVGLSDSAKEVGYSLEWHAIVPTQSDAIRVISLDDYLEDRGIERVDVMKLDVEGHELEALRGAEKAISERRIGAITLEAMDHRGDRDIGEPGRLLEEFGYRQVPMAEPNEAYVSPRPGGF